MVERDGLEEAKKWEAQAAIYYRRAAEAALQPREDQENKCIARGREWAKVYFDAAEECEKYAIG